MLTKRHRIQLGSVCMALGAVIGLTLSPWIGTAIGAVLACGGIRWRIGFLCALGFAGGLLWGWSTQPRDLDLAVRYDGVVTEEPEWAWSWTTVRLAEGGTVAVRSRGSVQVRFGDAVSVTCEGPWTRRAVYDQSRCGDVRMAFVAHDRAGTFATAMHRSRAWLERVIAESVPYPEAALLSGILLGGREDIPDEIAGAFRATGTSHIVAVSGYNVSVVVTLIAALFVRMPIPRAARLLLTLVAIGLFVVVTGSSASVVRAGLMGSMVLVGRAAGRLGDAFHGLILCAAAMIIATPAVAFDIGFQLSVAATLGLVALSDPIGARLHAVTERFGIRTSLASTLAAIAMTQPLIMLYFGSVSLVAPFVNLVVLPLVPLTMMLGACVMAAYALLPASGTYVGWIAWLPLRAIIGLVDAGSRVPFASVVLPSISSSVIAGVWALGVAWFGVHRRRAHA